MTFTYPAVVFQNKNGYNICFPDLEYLGITGSTLEYAENFAREDMRAYLIQLVETRQPLPEPTPLDQVDPAAVEAKLSLPFEVESASKMNLSVDIPEIQKA